MLAFQKDPDHLVAVCTNLVGFQKNGCLNPAICKEYPGSGYLPLLAELLKEKNIGLVSGDVAVRAIQEGRIFPQNVKIISECHEGEAETLKQLGATLQIITCFESPLYAFEFYDHLQATGSEYAHRFFFESAYEGTHFDPTGNHEVFFANCQASEIASGPSWKEREDKVCLVAANKHYSFSIQPKIVESRSGIRALQRQLHDVRIEAIAFFGGRDRLHLYGKHWELGHPKRPELDELFMKVNQGPVEDKRQALFKYRYALVIENVTEPGYLTEKIFDCFATGTIPIYLGDPDIESKVPAGSFLNLKHRYFGEVMSEIDSMTEERANAMIAQGQDFLKQSNYTFEAQAKLFERHL